MTTGVVAMLLGVFVVPVALLWVGHRLRRRSPVARGAFWGALWAHVLIAPVAMVASMMPAAEWSADDIVRGALGFWAPLVGPVVGALVGAALAGRRGPDRSL